MNLSIAADTVANNNGSKVYAKRIFFTQKVETCVSKDTKNLMTGKITFIFR